MIRSLASSFALALGSAVALAALAGCVDKSPNRVKLTATVENVELTVEQGPLVTSLAGTFDLALEVGDLASKSATIADAPSIDLVAASSHASLSVLDAVPGGDGFPVTLHSGDSKTLAFTLSDQNDADLDAVCAGPVQVAVTYRDSLADRPTLVDSAAVSVAGCP